MTVHSARAVRVFVTGILCALPIVTTSCRGLGTCGDHAGDFNALTECLFGPSHPPGPNEPPPTTDDCLADFGADVDLHDSAGFQHDFSAEHRWVLLPPPAGQICVAAFPDFGGWEETVSAARIADFEALAGRPITWAYFSNNWWRPDPGIQFPRQAVERIYCEAQRLPFIRMMPRNEEELLPDPDYTMQAFIDGRFDPDLTQWALDAKATGIPLLVEFGTECNGSWFPWNAQWNGEASTTDYGDPTAYDGMERFRDAYRHVIDLCDAAGAYNITWVFHVDVHTVPDTPWNRMAGYYPGDDYIDWIGVSAYGTLDPNDDCQSFESLLDDSWAEISTISTTGKPIAIVEWGVIEGHSDCDKAAWITDAFATVLPGGNYFGQIQAMSYWHENWDNSRLRIDSSPEALSAYQSGAASPSFISTPEFGQ